MQQKKIVTLHAQGCSMRKISKLLGLDCRTVISYVKKYKASGIDPSELIKSEKDLRVPLCLDAQGKLIAMIHEQFKAGQLTLPKSMSTQDYTKWKRLMYTKGFNVYAKKAFGGPDQVLDLGRYTHKLYIRNHRILKMTKLPSHSDTLTGRENQLKCETICGVKFLKLFTEHILPKRFVKIRHIGFLAPRFKARNLKFIRKHLKVCPPEVIEYNNTRDFITSTTGIDPHLCPKCHKGEMVISPPTRLRFLPFDVVYRHRLCKSRDQSLFKNKRIAISRPRCKNIHNTNSGI